MENLKSNYRRAVFVWLAMVGGIFFFLLLVELSKPDIHFLQRGSLSPEVTPITYFLLSFSALTLFLIWFVRNQILNGKAPGAKTPASRLLTASIMTDALCELMAINGLTLFLLTRNPLTFYIFLLLSFVLFTYFFPRYAQWEEWAGKAEGIESLAATFRGRPILGLKLHQGGTPAPGIFASQTEGNDLRQAAQYGMDRPA